MILGRCFVITRKTTLKHILADANRKKMKKWEIEKKNPENGWEMTFLTSEIVNISLCWINKLKIWLESVLLHTHTVLIITMTCLKRWCFFCPNFENLKMRDNSLVTVSIPRLLTKINRIVPKTVAAFVANRNVFFYQNRRTDCHSDVIYGWPILS